MNYGVTAEEVASGVGEESTIMRVATNTIYSNAMYPSHVAIPMRKVWQDDDCGLYLEFDVWCWRLEVDSGEQ